MFKPRTSATSTMLRLPRIQSSVQTIHRHQSFAAAAQPSSDSDTIEWAKSVANIKFGGLEMSPTLGINEMQNLVQSQDKNVYKFGFGQSPMPVPTCMQDRLRDYAHAKDYLPVQGLYRLRESIANHFNDNVLTKHRDITPERMIITPGTKQAFFLLKIALSDCSQVLLPSPSWVSYGPQSQIIGRDCVWIPTSIESNWKVLPSVLESFLKSSGTKQRLLILNSPSNPTGVKYTFSELSAIAEVCRKYNVYVLSDEIYGDIYHDNADSYYSLYDLYPENTIITNGISKSLGAGGWRLGYIIFPTGMKWLLDPVFIASSESHTSVAAPIQHAACAAFDDEHSHEIGSYLKVKRKILSSLAHRSFEKLSSIDGCKVVKPNGGFYIFPDFTNVPGIESMKQHWMSQTGKSAQQWCALEFGTFLLQQSGVAGLAGSCFGRPKDELSMRLSYVDFDGTELMANVNADQIDRMPINSVEMDDILDQYCQKTIHGMDVLADYLKSL